MNTALATLTSKLAATLDMGDGAGLIETLKATAFKGQVSDAQMTALMVVANQYGLNPWTKEIYAFPDKNSGIVPVVGVDGWSRIINNHPQFDGIEFEQNDDSCTCIIFRKDRGHPTKVTEWMAECRRDGVGPWKSHPWRMLRHKSLIQCARLAFGYGGIYDTDEAERIVEATGVRHMGPADEVKPEPKPYPQEQFDAKLEAWEKVVESGRKTPDELITFIQTRDPTTPLTEEQKKTLRAIRAVPKPARKPEPVTDVQPKGETEAPAQQEEPGFTFAQVADSLTKAASLDALFSAADLIGEVADPQHRAELTAVFSARQRAFGG